LDTGLYFVSADVLGVTIGGTKFIDIDGSYVDVSGKVSTFAGNVSEPSYHFDSDRNTGMWHPADDEIAFSTGGVKRLEIESDGTLNTGTTANYENLVTADDDIPNKKYVDDAITNSSHLTDVVEDTTPQLGGDLDVNGNTITGLPDTPTAGSEATSKNYVDGVSAGLDPKQSCRVASTENIAGTFAGGSPGGVGTTLTITGSPTASLTIDNVTLVNGDRVLLKDQTSALQNGIYVVSGVGSAVVLTRATDFDDSPTNEVDGGEYSFVIEGSTHAGQGFVVVSTAPVHMDNDDIIWTQYSGGNQYLPLSGGTMSGNIAMGSNDITGIDDITGTGEISMTGTGTNRLGTNQIANNTIDIARYGTGDRSSVLDFTSSTADETSGYSTRIQRFSGEDGNFTISNRGDGSIVLLTISPSTGDISFRPQGDSGKDIRVQSDGTLVSANSSYETLVTNDDDIPNKKYVDDAITTGTSSYLPLSGGTMSGAINLDGNNINNLYSLGGSYGTVSGSPVPTNGAEDLGILLSTNLHLNGRVLAFSATGGDWGGSNIDHMWYADTGLGTTAGTFYFAADSAYKATVGKAGVSAKQFFGDQILAAATPTYTFAGDDNTGFSSPGANILVLTTGGTERLRVESNGTLNVSGTTNYETLVTSDDDIPNKKYIDDNTQNATTLTATTTNATQTELVGSGSSYFTIATDTSYLVDINIVARRTDALGSPLDRGAWNVKVMIENNSGTTALVGETSETEITNGPGWSISVTADDSNDRLAVKVTGEAAKTISWAAKVTSVSVS
jgi:hypothetical protein